MRACVCDRERERERERGGLSQREITFNIFEQQVVAVLSLGVYGVYTFRDTPHTVRNVTHTQS